MKPFRPSLDNTEIPLHYLIDMTGRVMIVTSQKELQTASQDLKETFQKSLVLLTAITTALGRANVSVFDYDSWSKVVRKCGFFNFFGAQHREFSTTSVSMEINAQVVKLALSSIGQMEGVSGAGQIAKKVVGQLQGEAAMKAEVQNVNQKSNIGHMLLVCQDMLGLPIVSVSGYFASLDELKTVVKTPCAQASNASVKFIFHEETYMFSDPAILEKFTK